MNRIKLSIKNLALMGIVGLLSTCGGGGSSGGGSTGPTGFPRYAYVVNANVPSVSTYAVDNETGRWQLRGSGVAPQVNSDEYQPGQLLGRGDSIVLKEHAPLLLIEVEA